MLHLGLILYFVGCFGRIFAGR